MKKKVLPEAMKTNITFIDEEHAALIQISEDLIEVSAAGDCGRLRELLDFLKRYTETHFLNEEQLMTERKCANFPFHKEEHDYFRQYIVTSIEELESGSDKSETVVDIMETMKDWIVNHINKVDILMTASLDK